MTNYLLGLPLQGAVRGSVEDALREQQNFEMHQSVLYPVCLVYSLVLETYSLTLTSTNFHGFL